MDVSGSYTLYLPREQVWRALLDPDVLRRVVPGCEELERTGEDRYRGRVRVGVAAVKGTYDGTLRLVDRTPPERCTVVADGKGTRGVIHGESTITLAARDAGTTVVTYSGKAQLGGPIAQVGTRVVGGAANMLIRSFFATLADVLAEAAPAGQAEPVAAGRAERPTESGAPPEAEREAHAAAGPALATGASERPLTGAAATSLAPTSSAPLDGASASPSAQGAAARAPATQLVRRLGLSDGSIESDRLWSNRVVVAGLAGAAATGLLTGYLVGRFTRR